LCSADYWMRHVRETVRFARGVGWLVGEGVGSFLELGPDGVLSGMVGECVEDLDDAGGVVAGPVVRGGSMDWERVFDGTSAKRLELPGYAFQRHHYWFDAVTSTGDASAIGQVA